MDSHTLELLEFPKIRELVASYAASSLGTELAKQLEPKTNYKQIREEQDLVTQMVEALGQGHSPPFGGLRDVRLLVRRAGIGAMLTADELLEVAEALMCTGHMFRYRMRLGERFQGIIALLAPVEDLGVVAKNITGCVDHRGHLLDGASRELSGIRQKLANLDERVQAEIRKLLQNPELRRILRYPNATVSGDHYVLPVAANHRQKVPGVVHRTSSTGETIFIEPTAVASLSAERTILKGEEDRARKRILRKLSSDVGKVAKPLTYAIDAMAKLDFLHSKARFSRDFRMAKPDVNDQGRLWLRSARHPLLQHLFREEARSGKLHDSDGSEFVQRDVVPIDVRLGTGFNMLVITGPNTGGKTVALKTTGLLCLMAQAGLHIPANEGSLVPIFTKVMADIGDEQSLEQSLSTFSSHISRIATILREIDDKSLVLLDELGAGTDPTEGAALGRAILDELDRKRCRAMVTTHLGDLKTYAFSNDRAENGAVEFDVQTLRPTYRLFIGQYGMSNALKIARRLKLPRQLLNRAHKYLKRRQKRAPEMKQLQKMKEVAEKAREDALKAQHEAEKQQKEYEQELERAKKESEKAQKLREARLRLQPGDTVDVPKFDKQGQIVRVDHKRNIVVVSLGLGQWEVTLEDVFPVGL
ncbi:MAG: endonuclease MutS2 [Gemmataceae bacterium]